MDDQKKEYTTEEAVDCLVDSDLEDMLETGDIPSQYLDEILRKGFVGYESYSQHEIEKLLRDRLDNQAIKVVNK